MVKAIAEMRLTRAIAEMKCDTEQTMKLEKLYKASFECELNSWPDSHEIYPFRLHIYTRFLYFCIYIYICSVNPFIPGVD